MCVDLWIKFCFIEVDFGWGCFCVILLVRNCFLLEVDFFVVFWEDNECLGVDLEVEDFLDLDVRDWFGKIDIDDFGSFR